MFDAKGDLCVGFWKEVYEARPDLLRLPHGGTVLEIGCADADWLGAMHAHRPDLELYGVDPRVKTGTPPPVARLRDDILRVDFPPGRFDAAVGVSSIEHIGCEMYSQPPIEDGDTQTMRCVARWVKPGGWMYLDVPFRPNGDFRVKKGNYRAYNEQTLRDRVIVSPWREVYRQIFSPDHIDGPYIALILERV